MTTDGGRFDFEDGGAYVGGWNEGKAHGLGLVTGPRGQGEFAGLWEDGFEASGVYVWPSGNTFEGEWRQGKRHGLGTEVKGRWIYRGEWMTGFKGRYGVRQSEASGARYEGTWQLGMQDGAGVETYSDGSTFSGSWFHGTRHGLGIRQSVPFGLAAHYKEERRLRESLTSLRSQDEASAEAAAVQDARERAKRLDEPRGGFVLRGRMVDATAAAGQPNQQAKRNSLTKSLIGRLRKQRSAGDVNNDQRSSGRYSGSLRSALSDRSATLAAGGGPIASPDFFEEIVDPSTTEAYYGDWKQDKRAGLGVAERSDGLKYEGEWDGNKKHGYGSTTFPDGSVEAGKYKNNVLVASTAKRSKLFIIKTARLRERVETAVREARNAMAEAIKKAENAQSRQQVGRQKAELADQAAEKARQDAEMARRLAREYAPDFHQPGTDFLKRRIESDALNSLSLTTHQNGSKPSAFSASVTATNATNASATANARTLTRQRNIEESPGLRPPQQGGGGLQVDGILQVGGGGSRRGSFRAVRRGSGSGAPSSGPNRTQTPPLHPVTDSSQTAATGVDVNEVVTRLQTTPAAAQNPQLRRQQQQQHQQQQQPQQQMLQPNYSTDRVEPLTQILSSGSGAPASDHFDQYRSLGHGPAGNRKKRDSGIGRDSSFEESTASPNNSGSGGGSGGTAVGSRRGGPAANRPGDSDSGLSEVSAPGQGPLGRGGRRRRTMPSLLSCPPVRPATVGHSTLEDVSHSVDNLKNSSFIVENGIRKRVHAESRPCLVTNPASKLTACATSPPADPERLAPLPRHYRIESQAKLAKDLGEGSLPDVSVCRHIRRHGGVMSRDEVARLSEARRLELLRLEERRRQGEIVIRMADLKDWCQEHLLLLFVFVINTGLAILFFSLLTNAKNT